MSPRWERFAQPPTEAESWYLDATLQPTRSLSKPALRLVVAAFAGSSLLLGLFFAAHGAYPVMGFLGLDVLLLIAALAASNRAARVRERVQVAFDRVLVTRCHPGRAVQHWVVSPLWLRVDAAKDAIRLAAGGKALRLGAFLSPMERDRFADSLRLALWRARKGPPPSRQQQERL